MAKLIYVVELALLASLSHNASFSVVAASGLHKEIFRDGPTHFAIINCFGKEFSHCLRRVAIMFSGAYL